MGNHELHENGLGPIYSVPLIDTLPMNPDKPDGTLQQMPSFEDLTGIKGYPQGTRVCAGYEVLLHHWRIQKQQIERLKSGPLAVENIRLRDMLTDLGVEID